MQQLVQRQKFNVPLPLLLPAVPLDLSPISSSQSQETSSILTMIERKLLWVLETYSFLECLACGKLLEKSNQLSDSVAATAEEKQNLLAEEAEFCRFNANLCLTRSMKVASSLSLSWSHREVRCWSPLN
jgi:hypothetical protein